MIHVSVMGMNDIENISFDTSFCEVTESGALIIFDQDANSGEMLFRHAFAPGVWMEAGMSDGEVQGE